MTTRDEVLGKVERYYSAKLAQHGPTPQGADWNSAASQELRFAELARLWDGTDEGTFSVLDYGCGYGALAPYLRRRGWSADYLGFDVSTTMAAAASELHGGPRARFSTDESALPVVDYVVASGIFNVKLDTPDHAWSAYLEDTLDRFRALAAKGFAFNVLTSYSDPERRRPDLFYADPLALFDRCKRRYSRAVALLHDYPLYEFTILVRVSPGQT